MPIGAGFSPAGAAAAGYGVPDSATVPNNALLPDPQTGFSQTGRLIDPVKKSYVLQVDGRLQGFGTVPQLVQLALTTVLGSCAVGNLGQTFASITEKTSDYRQRVAGAAGRALADLVRQKLVQIISIDVQDLASNPDGGACFIKWRDLTTGVVQTMPIGP